MNKNIYSIISALWLLSIISTNAITDAEARVDAKKQELAEINLWTENLAKAGDLPRNEKFELLGRGLINMAYRRNWPASDERIYTLYDSLQKELLSTPGHAEYFRDKINEARRKFEDARDNGGNVNEVASYRCKLRDVILFDFPVFENLPSPETVRVLGEFLFDERGYVRVDAPKSEADLVRMGADGPVLTKSAESLHKLPLEDKPVVDIKHPVYINPEDVQPWRKWYDEIKSGKRRFRFKGDPTEYDLSGPTPQRTLESIALSQRMDSERAARYVTKNPSVPATPAAIVERGNNLPVYGSILAGFVVLALLAWHSRRKRNGDASHRP